MARTEDDIPLLGTKIRVGVKVACDPIHLQYGALISYEWVRALL
jgi:hypothetical protein